MRRLIAALFVVLGASPVLPAHAGPADIDLNVEMSDNGGPYARSPR